MIVTPFGPVPLWGRIEAGKPLLLVIRGAFPAPHDMRDLVRRLPHLSVAIVDLPGMHSPFFERHAVEDFAAAFDHIVDSFGGPTIVLGSSLGGVVAMAMSSACIRRRIALDPPLQTGGLWHLVESLQRVARNYPGRADWIHGLFGVTPESVENRDYRRFAGNADIIVAASDPLGEPRKTTRPPSVVSEEDRSLYRKMGATLITAPDSGHVIWQNADATMMAAIELAAASLASPVA